MKLVERASQYEAAMRLLQEHVTRSDDGTFVLDVPDGPSIGIDPHIFADLAASLERTNSMIRSGEISAADVTFDNKPKETS